MPNAYEYDNEDDGMRSALERARGTAVADEPEPAPMVLPEMDFSEHADTDPDASDFETQQANGPQPKETQAMHAARKAAEFKEEGDFSPRHFSPPPMPKAAPPADDEYTGALAKLKGILSKPTRDDSAGYGEAQKQDESENRTNRILDYLSAGLRRASSVDLTPAATHASDFLKRQGLNQQRDAGELERVGRLASVLKPAKAGATKDAGNVEGLRAYLVKVGAGTPEELAGLSGKELMNVKEIYGLKHNIDREPVEDEFKRTAHQDNVELRNATLAQTKALSDRSFEDKNKDQVSTDAKDLAAKLGDKAVFDQKYKKLKDLADANGGNLPGLGMVEGMRQQSGPIGSITRLVSPPSKSAVEGRKALRSLAQEYGNAISGAGVSKDERAQLNAASVDVENDDSNIAMAGLEALKEMYDAKAGQLEKGYRPEAVRQVSGGGAVKMSNGKETRMVPPEHVEEARAEGYR